MRIILYSMVIFLLVVMLSGCASTATYYDDQGNIIRVDKTTNLSRLADGTNQKSQIVLVEGTVLKFEASCSAGDNYAPGLSTKFINGKAAVINAKDNSNFNGVSPAIENFFRKDISASSEGIKIQ